MLLFKEYSAINVFNFVQNGDIISMISMYQLFEINALKSLTKEFQTTDRNLFLLISKKKNPPLNDILSK